MNLLPLLTAAGSSGAPTYVDDVFSAYTYTGNGGTTTIINGVDVKNKGGLVWCKNRTSAYSHYLADTARGIGNKLVTDTTAAQAVDGIMDLPTASGFRLSGSGAGTINESGQNFISWTFRKAAKFFDVVTYTGNGANRTIAHSLGQAPGMIVVKRTDSTSPWTVYHRSLANTEYSVLNTTAAKVTGATTYWNSTTADASTFALGTAADVNTNGASYVAYLFAHDTGTDGLIQCGTYTDGAAPQLINLGWEPQFLLTKRIDNVGAWRMVDASRGFVTSNGQNPLLTAESSDVEGSVTSNSPYALGFTAGTSTGQTFIYLAIRRPNKPPTTGTQVYNAVARSGTGGVATISGVGFAPDMQWANPRNSVGNNVSVDRLRGMTQVLQSFNGNNAQATQTDTITALTMDGATLGNGATSGNANFSSGTYINWFFKRAPGVFDEVCYTGTGSNTTQAHNLTVAPELMLVKQRSGTQLWACYASGIANTEYLVPSGTDAKASGATYWNSTSPTSSVFSIGTASATNTNAATYVAYLFATKAGISKVGSYTGGGNLLTYSQEFDNAAWVSFGTVTRTPNTHTAPDGTLTADTLTIAASSGIYQSVATTPGQTYIDSLWFRGDTPQTVKLVANTNLSEVSSTTVTITTSWQRVSLVKPTTTGTLVNLQLDSSSTGAPFQVWGAQLEAGAVATDYVQTTVAPAKRINCGFTTGARFILIKRTDSTGDWYVWDTVRGIMSGNDPHLSLNTTSAEVTTDDTIDPDTSGFIVNQVGATNVNVTAATYIYLAFA